MNPARHTSSPGSRFPARGAVLLEVILALVLFVGAVTVIGIAMSTSMEGVERQRMNVHAANLALSVLSEVQLGIRVPSGAGAEAFHQPFENWTAEVALSSLEDDPSGGGGLTRAEVVVRHRQAPIVYRVCQVFALDRSRPATRKEGPEK